MNNFSHVPPGFRFHPTDEELVDYYLRKKVTSSRIDLDVIKDVDLYKIEPWDLQELCRIGTEEQNEWYFFSHKDKKYPTGTRTNRATAAGFWKATGRDKAIYSKVHELIGMRKTLVFYQGRAPNGQKSDWIMHEYRLETDENGTPQAQEEGWVMCRVFTKRLATMRKLMSEHDSPCWYDHDQLSFMQDHLDSPKQNTPQPNLATYHHFPYDIPNCKYHLPHQHFLQSSNSTINSNNSLAPYGIEENHVATHEQNLQAVFGNNNNNIANELIQVAADWRALDKFVASQLSQEDVLISKDKSNSGNIFDHVKNNNSNDLDKEEEMMMMMMMPENASTSNSSGPVEHMWK